MGVKKRSKRSVSGEALRSLDRDLPRRSPTHALDDEARIAFSAMLAKSPHFSIQREQPCDNRDYGSDFQLEAFDGMSATNHRVHVQLKGTSRGSGGDGHVEVRVARSNLNYLLSEPDSCYVAYHAPTSRFLVRRATEVFVEYERSQRKVGWVQQDTVTVRFGVQEFDDAFQRKLLEQVLASRRADRNERLNWETAEPALFSKLIAEAPPAISVPRDVEQAHKLLSVLYSENRDRAISHLYPQFKAVLGGLPGRMHSAHMAEINLAMRGRRNNESVDENRLRDALAEFDRLLTINRPTLAGLRYNRGNCLGVLGRSDEAIAAYRAVLSAPQDPGYADVAPQCWMNLGAELERAGESTRAVEAYERALDLDSDLIEARLALANQASLRGDFVAASARLDGLIHRPSSAVDSLAMRGLRAKYRCFAGDVARGMDDIMDLTGAAREASWIWPWCANIVSTFGCSSEEVARKALAFWRRYREAHPGETKSTSDRLVCIWHLRMAIEDEEPVRRTVQDGRRAFGHKDFCDEVAAMVLEDETAATWWYRIGRWAEVDGDMQAAELAYRKAYDIDCSIGVDCLGFLLTKLGRHEEALPFLSAAAELYDDSLGWHRLGQALADSSRLSEAVVAYGRAIELDESEPLPWFNLGGALWNAGQVVDALRTWREAVARFPSHPLVKVVARAVDSLNE